MAQDESKNLQKYFENDPPSSLFDDLANKRNDFSPDFAVKVSKETVKVLPEVRDLWPYPSKSDKYTPTVPIVTTESLSDPITQAVSIHYPSELSKRKQPQMESLTVDDRGIKTLIDEKCYRAAISLTSRLLNNYGQGFEQKGNTSFKHSIHSLQLWHTRIALLIKINELEIAKHEAEAFVQLNNPDLFYEHKQPQTFSSKHGSMASFSFRLLLAGELPMKLNKPLEALNNLLKMLEVTRKIHQFFLDLSKKAEAEFWEERKVRVLSLMINCAMQLKNFDLAHQLFDEIKKLPNLTDETRFALTSTWGRTYLLSGDIKSAEDMFKQQQPKSNEEKVHKLIDQGLVAVAQNDYEDAFQHFQKAHELDIDNILILNNMAVCYLYTGKMHEAIKLYEQAINLNPQRSINEALLLNCSTLFELESNESKKKKVDLLKLVSANRADLEMPIEACLKL